MHAMNYTRLIRREKAAYWNKNAKANRERPRHPFAPWIRHWQWLVWGHPVGMQVSRKRVVRGAQCKDLDRLNERLDELDARQQRQLSELRDAVDTTRTQSPCRPEPPTTVDQRHLPDLRVESVAHSSRYTALLWIAQLLAYPGGCGFQGPSLHLHFFKLCACSESILWCRWIAIQKLHNQRLLSPFWIRTECWRSHSKRLLRCDLGLGAVLELQGAVPLILRQVSLWFWGRMGPGLALFSFLSCLQLVHSLLCIICRL